MLRALLLLPSLLGAALVSPISGPQECAKGSELWCQDLQAAARCGAVGLCRSAVWSQPTARSLPCDVCLDVTAAASNGLNPNATETDILALVTKTCEWLPSQNSSARCKGMVDAHSSAILNMLWGSPESTPAQVCAALTLCQPLQRQPATVEGPLSEEDTSEVVAPFLANGPLSFHPPQIPEDATCQDCVRLVSRLQEAVGSNLSSLAETATQQQCESLGPSLDLLCKIYVLRFLAPAERTLKFVRPEETCRLGGFCEEPQGPTHRAHVAATNRAPSLESPRKMSEVQMKAGLTCEVCLQVIQELDQWLESNSTEALINHGLERLCSMMPDAVAQQCVTLVDTYSPSIVEMVTRVNPENICKAVRLCSSQRRARDIRWPHMTTLPPLLDGENQGTFCNGCKRLLGVSSRSLERKSTKRNILAAFKGGCGILPLPYMIQCNRFVNEYEPVLIATLMEMMDPTALCTRMGACHSPRTPLLGTDQCVMGPSFWCGSQETAELCGAVDHCQRHIWKVARFHAGPHA
ncbi:prosaposin like 1 [Rhinolophus ferrumequinum]|uniref:Proactivator polypeptide-like 1 n=1 Tax=Rhinolophus ferrumequinum TaxID=59479 RepID=A0A671EF79_RHIFE|nr:proactivator polypeptide-like 1 [Rhinolophus ferrumequinum]KAF6372353.1 prosaposin like 1 [Rhinolophus ferrumequinum]